MRLTYLTSERTALAPGHPAKSGDGVKFQKSITINGSIAKIYAFWRNLENLPSFMGHLESVTVVDERLSYWVLRSSEDHLWGWGVEITEERENEVIAWRSSENADIQTAGTVRFFVVPEDRGTVVSLTMTCSPPVDKFLAGTVELFERDVRMGMEADLARLKVLLEGPSARFAEAAGARREKQGAGLWP